ncbi:MAG TPA: potassium-transporting ATPase subunit F [Acidimicrobiia bacterium]|nr:potassium-transporting ATPase subunit F [Acidimicrobiia bacterium]
MHTGEWVLLVISLTTAVYLVVAMWRPDKF